MNIAFVVVLILEAIVLSLLAYDAKNQDEVLSRSLAEGGFLAAVAGSVIVDALFGLGYLIKFLAHIT